jgi:hypothetical protein
MPHTRSSIPNGSLLGLAATRLIKLFPGTALAARAMRIISEFHAKSVAGLKPASVNIIKPVSARCSQRACAFPAVKDGLCRGHFIDAQAEYSMLPSTTSAAISGLSRLIA